MDVADALSEAIADDDGDIRWAAANLMVRLGREYPAEIRARLLTLARRQRSQRAQDGAVLYPRP